jgi:uncharacterized membrane protein
MIEGATLTPQTPRPKWPALAITPLLLRVAAAFGGAVAQLGERLVRNEEVRGSSPLGSTRFPLIHWEPCGLTGTTSLIGVIIARAQAGTADPLLRTHYRFQIRTFWIGVLYLAVGIILATAFVGIAVLFWWFVWSLVRNVKGVLALNEGKPIQNPTSWMFG